MASIFRRQRGGKPAGPYVAAWIDPRGRRQTRTTGTTDKAAAKRIANQWESAAALRRSGVIDSRADEIGRQAARPIVGTTEQPGQMDDYQGKLKTAGRTESHVKETKRMILAIVKNADWHRPIDIQPADLETFLATLSNNGRSPRTIQKYIRGITGFTRWMAKQSRIERDPLQSISAPSPESDRRLVRRFMLPEEWHWMKTILTDGDDRFGMSSIDRMTLYWTALETGLRANELRTLRRGNLELSAKVPFVFISNRNDTKNRKVAKQYIGTGLASRLNQLAMTKTPTAKLFHLPPKYEMANMLRADLAAARSAWLKEAAKDPRELAKRTESDFLTPLDHNQEHLDFHALRHTCGAWLAKAGERPQVIQAVMRHSSITLTMDTYGHLFPDDRSGAVGKVQGMLGLAPLSPFLATEEITQPSPDGEPKSAPNAHQMRTKSYAKAPFCQQRKMTKPKPVATKLRKCVLSELKIFPVFRGLFCWTLRKSATACRQKRE